MNALVTWFGSEAGTALLLALAHSLWMAAVLAFFAALALQVLPVRRTGLRYTILLVTQGAVLLATLFVWSLLSEDARRPGNAEQPPPHSTSGEVSLPPAEAMPASSEEVTEPAPGSASALSSGATLEANRRNRLASGLGLIWALGTFLVLACRLYAYGRTWRLCRRGQPIVEGPWWTLLEAERRAMSMGRTVALRVVEGLKGPAAYGLFRPVILIPSSLLTGMPEEAMRAVLVHELNHLRRWDPLVQALQQVVEALFFFNPFVWLLSRWIGLEREARCDRAVSARVDASTYAQLLLDLSRRGCPVSPAQVAATGDGRGSSLAERLRRLVRPAAGASTKVPFKLLPLALALAVAAIFVGRQAADATVDALSQKEWMQRIQAALAMEDAEHPRPDWKPGDEMRLVGKVLDSEGRSIPGAHVFLRMYFADGSQIMSSSTKMDESTGAFERDLELTYWPEHRPYATVTLTAMAPGHNAVEAERVPTRKGEASFDFRLEKGAPVEVVLKDEQGEAVPEATITLRMHGRPLQNISVQGGRTSIRVPAQQELYFEVEAEGYRNARNIRRQFSRDGGRLELTMTQGPPIRGFVYDAATGAPIEGAGVFSVESISATGNASRGRSFWVGQDDPLVRTEADGSFAIHSLEEDWMHWLVIQKEGYLVGFSGEGDSRKNRRLDTSFAVSPGNDPVEVGLLPQEELDVTVLLPEDWPVDEKTEVKFRYSHSYMAGLRGGPSSSHGSRLRRRKATPEDGALRFKMRPTMAVPLSVGLNQSGGPRKTVEGWSFDEPVVVDLSDKPAVTSATVDYVVRFRLPEEAPEPEGHLHVKYTDSGYVSRNKREIPIINREARFAVEQRLDRPVRFDSTGVIGYHFPPVQIPPPDSPPEEALEWEIKHPDAAGALSLKLENTDPEAKTQIKVESSPAPKQIGARLKALWPGQAQKPFNRRFQLPRGQTELLLTPIPFDTRLRLTVRHENLFFESKPVALQKGKAFDAVTLRLPDGAPLAGRVLRPDGEPVADAHVGLGLVQNLSGNSYSTHHFSMQTDRAGQFRFERINTDVSGIFFLYVNGVRGVADFKQIIDPKQENLTLRLPPAKDLQVRVVDAATGAPLRGLEMECQRADLPDNRRFLDDFKSAPKATDAEGWTRFIDMPMEGSYLFRVWLPLANNGRSGFNVTRELPPPEDGKRSIIIEVER